MLLLLVVGAGRAGRDGAPTDLAIASLRERGPGRRGGGPGRGAATPGVRARRGPTRPCVARLRGARSRDRGVPARRRACRRIRRTSRCTRRWPRGRCPFTVQGPDNGMAIEGGETLGYEIASRAARSDGVGSTGSWSRWAAARWPARASGPSRTRRCSRRRRAAADDPRRADRGRLPAAQRVAFAPACSSRGHHEPELPDRELAASDPSRRRRGRTRGTAPLRVHVAVGGGADERRHRHPRRRDLRLGGGGRRDAARPAARRLVVDEATLVEAERAWRTSPPGSRWIPPARPGSPGCSSCVRSGDGRTRRTGGRAVHGRAPSGIETDRGEEVGR